MLRTTAGNEPYQPGGAKRAWFTPSDLQAPNSQRLRAYCEALLSADLLEIEVPHLADIPAYLQITDPEALVAWEAKKGAAKKRRKNLAVATITDVDDWDLEVMQPQPKPRQARVGPKSRVRGKKPDRALADVEGPEDVGAPDPVEEASLLLPASCVEDHAEATNEMPDEVGELMNLLEEDGEDESDDEGEASAAITANSAAAIPSTRAGSVAAEDNREEQDPAVGGCSSSESKSSAGDSSSSSSSSTKSSSTPPDSPRPKPKAAGKRKAKAKAKAPLPLLRPSRVLHALAAPVTQRIVFHLARIISPLATGMAMC